MLKTKKQRLFSAFILFLLSFSAALSYNLINHRAINEVSPEALREGISVQTSDDASYLATAENFLKVGVWRENSAGRGAYFLRPPAYGSVYLLFRSFLTEQNALIGLLTLQLTLFALSIVAFWRCLVYPGISERYSWIIALFFGVSPFLHGFLFYTLTEGLTPALLIFYLFFLLKAYYTKPHRIKWTSYIASAVIMALLFIMRPVLILFILPLLFFVMFEKSTIPKLKVLALILIIVVSPMFMWQLRNYHIAGEVVGLHPIYYAENNSIFRPAHRAIWNFHKSWGQKGNEFHKTIVPLWDAAIAGDSSEAVLIKTLDLIPLQVRNSFDQGLLKNAYRDYQQFIFATRAYWLNKEAMPNTISPKEKEIIEKFELFAREYRQQHFMHSNILVPLQVYASLAFHSNLSLYVFQKTWRRQGWVEALRYLYFILHSGIFILFPIAFLFKIRNRSVLALGLPIIIYLGYLCFVQRGVEERYTLPVLLPMVMVVVFVVSNFKHPHYLKKFFDLNPIRDRQTNAINF